MAYPGYPPAGGYPGGGYAPPGGYPGGYPGGAGGYPQPGGGYPPAGGGYPPAGGYPQGGYPGGYVRPMGYTERRLFYIESEMNGKVLDIQGGHAGSGAKVCIYHRHHEPRQNQLWYADQGGIIRSALNDFALHSNGQGHHVKMEPFNGSPEQQFRFFDRKIVLPGGECLDVKGESHMDSAEVIAYHYKGSSNQHWIIHYVG